MNYEKFIGIIVPSSGIVTEMLFHRYAPPHVGVSTARVKFNQITFDGLSDMLNTVGHVAEDLCCVEPDIIVFSSVMAGAINGKSITNIVEQSTGTPCITGFYAMLEAMEALNIQHPTVISPHTDQLNLVFKKKLMQNGIRAHNFYPLDLHVGEKSIRAMEQISLDDVRSCLQNADLSGSDCLILNAACVQGSEGLQKMERDVGLPILQGDQVSLWSALRTMGDHSVVPELGRLFEV